MKHLLTLGLITVVFFSCQQDPQEHASNQADKQESAANAAANAADDHMEKSIDASQSAVVHLTQAQMSANIAQVTVPSFKNARANELTKKLGNEAVDYVNANNSDQADRLAQKIQKDLDEVDMLHSKGKLTDQEAQSIKDYAQQLADAVAVNIAVIVDTTSSN